MSGEGNLTLLALESGERGIAALKLGAKDALYDRASRRARQMEEGGIMNTLLEILAHKVVEGEATPRKVKVEKLSSLDDGVKL